MSVPQRPNYSDYADQLIKKAFDSRISFEDIDTPGWTSMVRTSHALTQLDYPKYRNSYDAIPGDSVKFDGKDISNRLTNKIRPPKGTYISKSSTNQLQNQPPFSMDDRKCQSKYTAKADNRLKDRIEMRLRTLHVNSEWNQSQVRTQQSIPQENNSRKTIPTQVKTQLKSSQMSRYSSVTSLSQNKNKSVKKLSKVVSNSRFKQITVHEHLYMTGKKLEKKKEIRKILDQKYHNEYVTPFQPVINCKSTEIAEKKINKQDSRFSNPVESSLPVIKENEVIQDKDKKKSDNQRKLFLFLSEQTTHITDKTLNSSTQTLPLPCVSLMSNLFKWVYSGHSLNYQQFNSNLQNKKLVTNRDKLTQTFIRWMQRQNIEKLKHLSEIY